MWKPWRRARHISRRRADADLDAGHRIAPTTSASIRDEGLCPCGHARDLLTAKLKEIERQMAQLEDLRSDIRGLVDSGDVADDGCWPCGSTC